MFDWELDGITHCPIRVPVEEPSISLVDGGNLFTVVGECISLLEFPQWAQEGDLGVDIGGRTSVTIMAHSATILWSGLSFIIGSSSCMDRKSSH